MQSLPEFPEPLKCTLWRNLEPLENIPEIFEAIETYVDDSHHRRSLLKCRECGQLYFYEFLEFVDYENGDDPQYRAYTPAIHSDWPKGQDRPAVFWVGRNKSE